MDLFCISSVKQSRAGGLEMTFFDRFEALDRLAELDRQEQGGAEVPPFYTALVMGARALAQAQEQQPCP